MAAKSLDIHPAALEEAISAVQWYLAGNETAARKFSAELDRALDLIVQAPARWPLGESGTRSSYYNDSHSQLFIVKKRKRSKCSLSLTGIDDRFIGKNDSEK